MRIAALASLVMASAAGAWQEASVDVERFVYVVRQAEEAGEALAVRVEPTVVATALDRVVGAESIELVDADGVSRPATGVVGIDEVLRIALLRIDGTPGEAPVISRAPFDEGDAVGIARAADGVVAISTSTVRYVTPEWVLIGGGDAAPGTPVLSASGELLGMVVGHGGGTMSAVSPLSAALAMERIEPMPIADLDAEDVSAATRARLLAGRARSFREARDIETAMAFADEALGHDPACAAALYESGLCADIQRDFEHAEGQLRRAVEADPLFADAWLALGTVALHQRRLEAAIEPLQQAIEIDPDFALAHGTLAIAHLRLGHTEAAVRHADEVVDGLGAEPPLFRNLTMFFLKDGLEDAATRVATRWVELYPEDGPGWSYLGRLHFDGARFDQAATALARAVEITPRDGGAWLRLALARLESGDVSGAREAIEVLLERQPDNPVARDVLERIEEAGG